MSGSLGNFTLDDIDVETPVKLEKASTGSSRHQAPRTKSSRKRKTTEVVHLDEPSSGAEALELAPMAFNQIPKFYYYQVQTIEDLRKIGATKSQHIEDCSSENSRLKKEVDRLNKEVKDLKKTCSQEKAACYEKAKLNATKVILEAQIRMAGEAATKGFDTLILKLSYGKRSMLTSKVRILVLRKVPNNHRWIAKKMAEKAEVGSEGLIDQA